MADTFFLFCVPLVSNAMNIVELAQLVETRVLG